MKKAETPISTSIGPTAAAQYFGFVFVVLLVAVVVARPAFSWWLVQSVLPLLVPSIALMIVHWIGMELYLHN